MAILTTTELAELRRDVATRATIVNYNKAQVNAAFQAIEDWFEITGRQQLNQQINNATAPLVLTAPQKNVLVAYWLRQKFFREGGQ